MKPIILTVIAAVGIVGVLVWVKSDRQNLELSNIFKSGPGTGLFLEKSEYRNSKSEMPISSSVLDKVGTNPKSEIQNTENLDTEYNNSKFGFSFKYPSGFKAVANSVEGGGEVITVEKDPTEGFQIFILPFDESFDSAQDEPFDSAQGQSGPITPERIKRDIPDLIIKNPQYISVDETQALAFYSQDQDLGETYEVWFTHKGKLYQVTTYKKLSELVMQILKTWRFQ